MTNNQTGLQLRIRLSHQINAALIKFIRQLSGEIHQHLLESDEYQEISKLIEILLTVIKCLIEEREVQNLLYSRRTRRSVVAARITKSDV
jgi:negative regulator of replication initiation